MTEPTGPFKRNAQGLPYLSPSQASTLLGCPARWHFRNILKRPDPSSPQQALGHAAHAGLEAWAKAILKGEKPSPAMAGDAASANAIERCQKEPGILSTKTGKQIYDSPEQFAKFAAGHAIAATNWLLDRLNEGWSIEAVEAKMSRPIDVAGVGVILNEGRLDMLLRNPKGRRVIFDLKTATKSPSSDGQGGFKQERRNTLQLAQYGSAMKADDLLVLTSIKRKTAKDGSTAFDIAPSTLSLTPELMRWADRAFCMAARVIERQDFDPNPIGAGFSCSPSGCNFFGECVGAQPGEAGGDDE
jgi:hypothetical protein